MQKGRAWEAASPQSSVRGSMMPPSTAFRFWVTEARNAINSPVKVTPWEEGIISLFLPRMESAFSTRHAPGGQVRRPSQRSFSCKNLQTPRESYSMFRCSSLCQEKKDLLWSKGFYFHELQFLIYWPKERAVAPFKSTFPDPSHQMANISWLYYLNKGKQITIFVFLLEVEIMTRPSSRIIVKIKWDDSCHFFVLVT